VGQGRRTASEQRRHEKDIDLGEVLGEASALSVDGGDGLVVALAAHTAALIQHLPRRRFELVALRRLAEYRCSERVELEIRNLVEDGDGVDARGCR
jgi:hypothetical protein